MDRIGKMVGADKVALLAYLRVNGNRKQDFRDCGKPNPLNPPCQGDLSLNSSLIRGARGLGMTNIGFLHSRTSGLLVCEWNRKGDFRDCGKPNPLNPSCQGDLSLNSPLIRGARGVRNDKYWFLAQSLSQERRILSFCTVS